MTPCSQSSRAVALPACRSSLEDLLHPKTWNPGNGAWPAMAPFFLLFSSISCCYLLSVVLLPSLYLLLVYYSIAVGVALSLPLKVVFVTWDFSHG